MKSLVTLYLVSVLCLANTAFANPTTGVARLSYINGNLSLLPAAEEQWVKPLLNRPLVLGDNLWADSNSKIELELGSAKVWLNGGTSFKLLNLTQSISQFQLAEGSMVLSVTHLKPNQTYEIDTPNLALSITQPGLYRINVVYNEDQSVTSVRVSTGLGEAHGQTASSAFQIQPGQNCQFRGVALQNPECSPLTALDSFDKWILERSNRTVKTASSKPKVSNTVLGYQDLDTYGSWTTVENYGDVWIPGDVDASWTPYSDGQWQWLSDWGWTWVDNSPWGFAPFHYGRWAHLNNRWAWVPGPVNVEAVYAPALVIFIESSNNSIAWFPLAPGEIYVPVYNVSRDYFYSLNSGNTVLANRNIDNWYNNTNVRFNYRNSRVANAITSMTRNGFVQAQPVHRARTKNPSSSLVNAKTSPFAPLAPTNQSVLGGNLAKKPPEKAINQSVIVKTQAPKQPEPFSKVKDNLIKNPGKPLASLPAETPTTQKPIQTEPNTTMPVVIPVPVPGQKPAFETIKPLKPQAPVQHPQQQAPAPQVKPQAPVQHPQQQAPAPKVRPQAPVQHPQQQAPAPQVRPQAPVQHPQQQAPAPQVRPQAPVQHPQQQAPAPQVRPQAPVQHPQQQAPAPQVRPQAPVQHPQQQAPAPQVKPQAPVQHPQQQAPAPKVKPQAPVQHPQQ